MSNTISQEFNQFLFDLKKANQKLPDLYRISFGNPFINQLELNPVKAVEALTPPQWDCALAIFKHGKTVKDLKLDAIAAIISRIYRKITKAIPPLPIWKKDCQRFYTLDPENVEGYNRLVSILVLPNFFQDATGVMCWAVVLHEAAGNAFLEEYKNQIAAIWENVKKRLEEDAISNEIITYFSMHWKPIVKDCVGFLTLGPGTAAIFSPKENSIRSENFPLHDSLRILIAHEVMAALPLVEEPLLPDVSENIILGITSFSCDDVRKGIIYIIEEFFKPENGFSSLIKQVFWDEFKESEMHHLIHVLREEKISMIEEHHTEALISSAVLATLKNPKHYKKIFNGMVKIIRKSLHPQTSQ